MKAHLSSFIVVALLCASPSLGLAADAESDVGQKHLDAGIAYVDDPGGSKWEEALREFRAAYGESHDWKMLNNIGVCALNLERDGEAIAAFKEYLSRGGEKYPAPKVRKQIEKDIAMLAAGLVTVNVEVEPPEAMLIDERRNSKGEILLNRYPIKSGKAELGLHPGHHKISIEAQGFVTADWTIDAEPASKHQHQFKLTSTTKPEVAPAPTTPAPVQPIATANLEPPKPAPRRNLTGVYIGLAATGVFTAAATVTGVIALGKDKDFENATDPAEVDSLKKSGKTFALLTDIGIGAAILSAGATAYFYFTSTKEQPTQTASRSNIRLSPVGGPNAAGLAISGKF